MIKTNNNWHRTWKKRALKIKKKLGYDPQNKVKFIRNLTLIGLASIVAMFFVGLIMFAWFAKDLPQPGKVVRREGFSTKIYDRSGTLLYNVFADQRRTPIELAETPEYLRQATVAVEDKNFYQHEGFDPLGTVRGLSRFFTRGRAQGGSTLTQQLVKNVLLTSERTITRKIKEFIMAVQIERRYSKEEILQMYLNEAPYGGTAWGVAAGAETYFDKQVADLNLVESAFLAGLPQSPTYYSPFGANPDAYISRTETVLRRMREDGYITTDQEQEAIDQLAKLEFSSEGGDFKAPHFVMYVKALLEEKYGKRLVEQGGLQVYTTLDWKIQEQAQEIVSEEIAKVESLDITNGASIVLDPQTGEILAMVGSKNYNDPDYDGKVNVTLRPRQPGSSIKPVTYVTALREGYAPSTVIVDAQTEFPGGANNEPYVPKNYDGQFHGPVSFRQALGNSLNIPAVKVLAMVGVRDMMEMAYDLGFTTLEPTTANVNRFGLSLTLGGGEIKLIDMAAAYSAFANEGYKVEPTAILKVEDSDGKVLEENEPKKQKQVLSEAEAYIMSHMLADNSARAITFGTNSLLNIPGHTVAVKTGTSNDMRDNWAIGWTPNFIVGVWVGNNDNSQMKRVASGISGASPIWRRTIMQALATKPASEFKMPDDVLVMDVDQISGWPPHDGWPTKREIFIKGTQPTGSDPIHTRLKLCRGQDKLATDTQIAQGNYDEKEFIVLKENDPFSSENNRWQAGINAWIESQGDPKYRFPTEYCDSSTDVVVNFESPHDHDQLENEFTVKVNAVAEKDIDRVKIFVDGSEKASFDHKPFQTNLVLADGTYELKAVAWDTENHQAETSINVGVNKAWDWSPEPTPTPSPTLTPVTPTPTPSPTPTPTAP